MRLRRSVLSKPLLHVAGPSALVMAPLLGLTFHSDQRIMMYWLTGAFGADPLAIVNQNLTEMDDFLRQGNFRPLGRFVIYMEQTSIFEVAAGTGVAPHVVQGVVRLIGLDQWRDSLLVQVSWALILYGLAVVALSCTGRRREERQGRRVWLAAAAATAVLVLSANAFIANDKFSIWRRSGSDGSVVNLISTASVDFDRSEGGQAIRCELMSAYADRNCLDCWHSGDRVLEELNKQVVEVQVRRGFLPGRELRGRYR